MTNTRLKAEINDYNARHNICTNVVIMSPYSILELSVYLKYGHLMSSTDSLEKTLMLGKIEGRRRRGRQRVRWLDGPELEQALGDGDGQGSLACCSPWGRKESDTAEQLN